MAGTASTLQQTPPPYHLLAGWEQVTLFGLASRPQPPNQHLFMFSSSSSFNFYLFFILFFTQFRTGQSRAPYLSDWQHGRWASAKTTALLPGLELVSQESTGQKLWDSRLEAEHPPEPLHGLELGQSRPPCLSDWQHGSKASAAHDIVWRHFCLVEILVVEEAFQ